MTNNVKTKNINKMNDAMFKAIMCHENNREMVVAFLNSITGIPKVILRSANYISGEEIIKRKEESKKQTTDMTVKIHDKLQIIIEMNQTYNKNIFYKNTNYSFSRIVETTTKNMKEYPKVILINIDNFNRYKSEKPMLEFKLRDTEGHIENESYESIHLILENIQARTYNIDEEIEKFSDFLLENDLEKLEEEFKGDMNYMAAIRTVEDLSMDPEFAGYYDLEEAHKQELEDMKETGIDIGIEKGIEQGKKEQQIIMAKRMLAMKGITLEQIKEATGLSIEEIENLK